MLNCPEENPLSYLPCMKFLRYVDLNPSRQRLLILGIWQNELVPIIFDKVSSQNVFTCHGLPGHPY